MKDFIINIGPVHSPLRYDGAGEQRKEKYEELFFHAIIFR